MKLFIFLFMIIGVFIFQDCIKLKKDIDKPLLVFDLAGPIKPKELKLSEIGVYNIQYIALNTDTNYLISKIKKLITTNYSIVVLDDRGKIFQFNFEGKFINQIGSLGRGPGEYQYPSDITINNKDQQIIVCPLIGGNILKIYSFDGKFINSIPCPIYTKKIIYLNEGIFCSIFNWGKIGNLYNPFVLIDNGGNIIKEFPCKYDYRNSKIPNTFLEETLMYSKNGELFIKEIYSDTVFKFEKFDLKPKYILDHGGKTISKEVREKIISLETFMDVNYKYSKEIKLLEFGNYLFSEFNYHREHYGFIGSLDGKPSFLIDNEVGIVNDIDGGPNVRFSTIKDKTTIIGWIEAFKLKYYVTSETFKNFKPKFPEKKKELEKLAASLNENDNPVLILVKLKE
jgi:hypothetical protein